MIEERQGKIAEVIFNNQENGYSIVIFETEDEQFTAVGTLPSCRKGMNLLIRGQWKVHPSYGEQFSFFEHEEMMPSSEEGIEDFLASGLLKGIGKKTASAIVAKFGSKTLDIIENEPDRLTEISGIGPKKAEAVAEAFRGHREFANISLHLQQYGINADYAMKLYKVYGPDTLPAIHQNPYQLVDDVFGIGFRKADRIAEKMGIKKDDENRIRSGIKYTLTYFAGEGHTFLPQTELCEKTAALLEVSMEKISDFLVEMAFVGDVHIDRLENRNVVYLMPYYMAEQNVCKCIGALNSAKLKPIGADVDSLIRGSECTNCVRLSDSQKDAVKNSLDHGVSVITGGPGTGKTTIINCIVNILNYSGHKTAIAAPTGRAAKRITETSGYDASTIHRLLEYYYSESNDAMAFGKNSEDPLDYDVIIIDEASMIDLMLMNGLVNAIRPGTRLILVGDADQLPSVGAGNVLRDIIESDFVHCVKLTEIFRQAKESLIVVNAHKINKGEYPDCNEKDKDFFMMRQKTEKEMLQLIKDLCMRRLPAYYKDIMPVRDIQVLTPMRKGLLGTINLNRELQEVLNPPCAELEEKKFGDRIFREHDKVMQIRNNYELKWKNYDGFEEGEGVFNGDVGFINSIDREYGEVVVVYDNTKYVTYDFSQLDELELAYAVTVHKSQGSEFPIVIMPMSWFPPVLANRNLLYTGVTRGKQAVIMVGSENKMHAMIDNNSITERHSGLAVRLKMLMDFH